jgi:antitoxin YefM
MTTSLVEAAADLNRFCHAAAQGETVVIERPGSEDVVLIAASELSSILETLHLLRSPRNAARLFTVLERLARRDGLGCPERGAGLAPGG